MRSDDDLPLAPNAAPLVLRHRRQEVLVLRDELLLHLQARQEKRLALAREQAGDPRERLGIPAFADRCERLLDERQLARPGDALGLGLVPGGNVEREHVAVRGEERRFAHRIAHRAVIIERGADRGRCRLLDLAHGIVRRHVGALCADELRRRRDLWRATIETKATSAMAADGTAGAAWRRIRRTEAHQRGGMPVRPLAKSEIAATASTASSLRANRLSCAAMFPRACAFERDVVFHLPHVPAPAISSVQAWSQHPIDFRPTTICAFFLLRNLARHENAEVADVSCEADDHLAARFDFVGRSVDAATVERPAAA